MLCPLLTNGTAAKPVASPNVIRSIIARQDTPKVDVCASQGSGMIAAFAALEAQGLDEATQVKADNLIFIDVDDRDGRGRDNNAARKKDRTAAAQQLMLLQVNQALIRDQQANAAQKELDNVLRTAALAQREQQKSTVIVVVTEIKVKFLDENDNGGKREIEADLFKQEAIVANRGKQETKTVMSKQSDSPWCTFADCRIVFDSRTLTASGPTDAEATDGANATKATEIAATKTAEAVLYNARPTHSAIIEDPAALMREALEAALDDRRKDENRRSDDEENFKVAVEIKIAIEKDDGRDNNKNNGDNDRDNDGRERELERQRQQKQKQEEKDQQQAEKDRQEVEKQRAKEQQREQEKKDTKEKQKQEEEKAKAEAEKKKQEEEKAEAEAEKKKQEEEKAKVEAEKKKLEEEKIRVEADKKQQEDKAKVEAEQRAKDEQRKADEEKAKAEQQRVEEAKVKQEAEKAKLEAEKAKEQ